MISQQYNHRLKLKFLAICLIALILPPFFSMLYTLFCFIKEKNTKFGILFIFFAVLFLTYNFFSIDNTARILQAIDVFKPGVWYIGDPLTNFMGLGITTINMQASLFYFIYISCLYFFWLKTIESIVHNKFTTHIIVIFITTISLRYSLDLLYYCLAVTFALYFFTRKTKFNALKFLGCFVCIYILHPGFFLVLIPALVLAYSMKTKKWIYYASMVTIYLIYALLASGLTIENTGIFFIDLAMNAFSKYTSDGYWGIRTEESAIVGYSYTFIYYIVPSIYAIVFFLSVKYSKRIENKFILAIFQTAMIFYPNFINFVTLTERDLLTLSISAIAASLMIVNVVKNKRFIKVGTVTLFCTLLFSFSSTIGGEAVFLHNVFKEDSYQAIQKRSYYMPSFMLLNYERYGYSNDFIIENRDIKF